MAWIDKRTDEEKKAAEASRKAAREISKLISDTPHDIRDSIFGGGLVQKCDGEFLQEFNSHFLRAQCPKLGNMQVGGCDQWKAKANRKVCKGASALYIWIPTMKAGEGEVLGENEGGKGGTRFILRKCMFTFDQTEEMTEKQTIGYRNYKASAQRVYAV